MGPAYAMQPSRGGRLPALLGAILLHAAVIALGYLGFVSPPPPVVEVTPISLVTASALSNARAAVQAPEAAQASAPEPEPTPAPEPPVAKPAPPQKLDLDHLAKTRAAKALDLEQLARPAKQPTKSLDLSSLAATRPSAALRGPARAETAEAARKAVGAGTGLSADARSYLAGKLIPLWNPDCGVADAANVIVRVNIKLSPEGRLLSARDVTGAENAITRAAAVRALTAVKQAEPYDGLPREEYAVWRDVNFNFIAKDACR
jgi:protein TonB